MAKLINISHEVHEGTCYVNGLYDILTGKGAKYDYFLLPIIGGMASFAYLKFKMVQPPCMVYWGANTRYLIKDLADIIGFTEVTSEGKSFRNEFPKIKSLLDSGEPLVAGALDMYYLNYYPQLYHQIHNPIHYILVVGYDDEKSVVYVHDCSVAAVQEVPYGEFESALSVNVPGMSKKNTYRFFHMPEHLPSEIEITEKGLAHKAARMLQPPVNMLGVPAMRKLAKEITSWDNQECFKHLAAYAGMTPPLIAEDLSHNDGLRFEQARVLKGVGEKYGREAWVKASQLFTKSGELIVKLCDKAVIYDGEACSNMLTQIADTEQKAYELLE